MDSIRRWRLGATIFMSTLFIIAFLFLLVFGSKPVNACGGNPLPMLFTDDFIQTDKPIRSLSVDYINGRETVAMGFVGGGVQIVTPAKRLINWSEQCDMPLEPSAATSSTVNDVLYTKPIYLAGTDGAGPLVLDSAQTDTLFSYLNTKTWTADNRIYDLLEVPETGQLFAMTWLGIEELTSNGWIHSEADPPAGAPPNLHRCVSSFLDGDWYLVCGSIDGGIVQYVKKADGNEFWFHVLGDETAEQYNPTDKGWDVIKGVISNFTPNLRDIVITLDGKIVIAGDAGATGSPALFYYDPQSIAVDAIPTDQYTHLTGVAVTATNQLVIADYIRGSKVIGGDSLTDIPSSDVVVGASGNIYIGTDKGLVIARS